MIITNNPVSVTYTTAELRNLVEEYITQQRSILTLKGLCSYIFYWAVEDGKVADGKGLIDSNDLSGRDQERIKRILEAIVADGRITSSNNVEYRKL